MANRNWKGEYVEPASRVASGLLPPHAGTQVGTRSDPIPYWLPAPSHHVLVHVESPCSTNIGKCGEVAESIQTGGIRFCLFARLVHVTVVHLPWLFIAYIRRPYTYM